MVCIVCRVKTLFGLVWTRTIAGSWDCIKQQRKKKIWKPYWSLQKLSGSLCFWRYNVWMMRTIILLIRTCVEDMTLPYWYYSDKETRELLDRFIWFLHPNIINLSISSISWVNRYIKSDPAGSSMWNEYGRQHKWRQKTEESTSPGKFTSLQSHWGGLSRRLSSVQEWSSETPTGTLLSAPPPTLTQEEVKASQPHTCWLLLSLTSYWVCNTFRPLQWRKKLKHDWRVMGSISMVSCRCILRHSKTVMCLLWIWVCVPLHCN